MFLKKYLHLKDVIVNCRQFESLFQAVKAAPDMNFKAYSCQPISENVEVTMNVSLKEGTKSTNYEVQNVPGSKVGIGKALFWNECNKSLLYVDLSGGKLVRYDTKSNEIKKCQINGAESASFVVPVNGQDNQFIVGNKRNIELITWHANSESCCIIKTLISVQEDKEFANNRFNAGMIDDQGRLFAGTMADCGNEFAAKLGDLYMFDGKEAKAQLSNLGIPSGMVVNKDGNKFYIVDGGEYSVKEYDYCGKNGALSNPKVVYTWDKSNVPQHLLVPDGMTIDAKGYLYVCSNGGTIYKIDPSAKELCMEIKLPVTQVTDCTFGGPQMDILYVTTGSKFDAPPPAGQLFTITGLCATGLPKQLFKIT